MNWINLINEDNETIIHKLIENVHNSWENFFKDKQVLKNLNDVIQIIKDEVKSFNNHLEIFPPPNLVFYALNNFNVNLTKAIILGQDPYHQPNQAMGLSFSVPKNVKVPPSLVNIYKELSSDLSNFKIPKQGDLTNWKEENVLLLNSSLTVLQSKPMRHMKYWKPITDQMIEYISNFNNPKVFMLWGNSSKAKKCLIKKSSFNLILEANHPSPLSANREGWFGCKHFSKCNYFLEKNNINSINWNLD